MMERKPFNKQVHNTRPDTTKKRQRGNITVEFKIWKTEKEEEGVEEVKSLCLDSAQKKSGVCVCGASPHEILVPYKNRQSPFISPGKGSKMVGGNMEHPVLRKVIEGEAPWCGGQHAWILLC